MELKRFKAGGCGGGDVGLSCLRLMCGWEITWGVWGAEKTEAAAAGPRRDAAARRESTMGVPLLFLTGKTRKTPAAPPELGPYQPSP